MTNLVRKNQKVFAENAINNGQFGSLQDTTKVLSQDLNVLQANTAYPLGWNNATLTGEELPSVEELQSLNYINTSQTAYLLNKGIPEWVIDAEYYIGDIQREVAGTKIYKSLTNNNIGNVLTDVVNWLFLADLAAVPAPAASQVEVDAGAIADKYVAPSTLAGTFQFSNGTSGYRIYPNGQITQWIRGSVGTTSTTFNFPIPFGSDTYGVSVAPFDSNTPTANIAVNTPTTTSIDVIANEVITTFSVIAEGNL